VKAREGLKRRERMTESPSIQGAAGVKEKAGGSRKEPVQEANGSKEHWPRKGLVWPGGKAFGANPHNRIKSASTNI